MRLSHIAVGGNANLMTKWAVAFGSLDPIEKRGAMTLFDEKSANTEVLKTLLPLRYINKTYWRLGKI